MSGGSFSCRGFYRNPGENLLAFFRARSSSGRRQLTAEKSASGKADL
jgi:hypothetical protein